MASGENTMTQGSAAATSRADEPAAQSSPFVKGSPAAVRSGSLLGDINAVADAWFGKRWFDGGSGGVASPEELVAAAGERGVQVSYAQRRIASLGEGDFPCVVLDRSGESTIVTSRAGRSSFMCRKDGIDREISLADLSARHNGVVFFVKPKQDPAAQDPASPAELAELDEPVGLLRCVVREIAARHKLRIAQICVSAALSNLLLLGMPIFSMTVYDRVIPHLAMETLWALALGVCIALVMDFALRAARLKLSDAVGLNVSASLQGRLYARLLRAKAGEVPVIGGGVQSGLRDIETLAQILPGLFASIVVDVPSFLLTTALLYGIAGPLAWIPFCGVILIMAVQMCGDLRGERALEAARLSATQANLLLESVAGAETVKATTAASPLTRRFERLADAAAYVGHVNRLHGSYAGLAAVTISQGAVVAAMVAAVYLIGEGAMSLGALSASTLLIGRMMAPMSGIGAQLHRILLVHRSARTVDTILRAAQEKAGDPSSATRSIAGRLVCKNLGFTYPGETTPALAGVNLVIEPGERVGFVGRAGSGKSTLLKILLRLHDASEGALLLDDHDIRQIAPEAVRRHFGFMRQDASLFDDTLRNAMCFGLDSVAQEDFEAAAALSGVRDFATRHPAGYGLRVGPRGERLSGGERQSVMLARTLVGGPRALVLDEPTAAMDNSLEMRIVRGLRETLNGRTLIVSTHRAPMLALVDRLVWLDEGRVVADGPKEEVLRRISGASAA